MISNQIYTKIYTKIYTNFIPIFEINAIYHNM